MSNLIHNRLVFSFFNNGIIRFSLVKSPGFYRIVDERPCWRSPFLSPATKRKEPNKLALAVVEAFIFHISNTLDLPLSPVRLSPCFCKYTCIAKLRARLISDLSREPGNSSGTLSENGFSRAKPKFTEWIVPTTTRRIFIFIEPRAVNFTASFVVDL